MLFLLMIVVLVVVVGIIFQLLLHKHYELVIAGLPVKITKNQITKKIRVKVNKDTFIIQAHQVTGMKAKRGAYKVKKEWENESA